MWYIWYTGSLQGQHHYQTSTYEAQRPGPQGQQKWHHIQLPT